MVVHLMTITHLRERDELQVGRLMPMAAGKGSKGEVEPEDEHAHLKIIE